MSDTIYGRERCYERDVKEYEEERLAQQPARQLTMFQVLDPPPTEEELFAGLVRKLKEDIWQAFKGKTASRIDIHTAMFPKWFAKVRGTHFTQAFAELEEDGRITHCSGARSASYTVFTFRTG